MRYNCELADLEALDTTLATRCRERGRDFTSEESLILATTMLGHSGYADFLYSLRYPDREDLYFFLAESRRSDEPELRQNLIAGFVRLGLDWPSAKNLGMELFEQLSPLPMLQQLPVFGDYGPPS